jgi:hypothetical protein
VKKVPKDEISVKSTTKFYYYNNFILNFIDVFSIEHLAHTTEALFIFNFSKKIVRRTFSVKFSSAICTKYFEYFRADTRYIFKQSYNIHTYTVLSFFFIHDASALFTITFARVHRFEYLFLQNVRHSEDLTFCDFDAKRIRCFRNIGKFPHILYL